MHIKTLWTINDATKRVLITVSLLFFVYKEIKNLCEFEVYICIVQHCFRLTITWGRAAFGWGLSV